MEENSLTTRVVCDAGPLIHLQELAAVQLLADFAEVLVPQAVCAEVERHQPRALETPTVSFSRVADPSALDPTLETLARGLALGPGELTAIGLAQRESECLLLTDDAAARLAAEALGLRVHGTIGVILRSFRIGHQTARQVVALLEAIPARSTLHIRAHLLDEATRRVRELHSEG